MKKVYDAICAAQATIAATFLVLMVALIFLGGVARMFDRPLNWTVDISIALFAWACFLCADIAWRRDSLMSIGWLSERLPPRLRLACAVANYLIISAFLVYAIVMGLWLSWISRARSFQGIAEISFSWVTMSMPVGAALLLITTVLKLRATLAAHAAAHGHAGPVAGTEARPPC
jgi:TRAP-type C4-dicarboxylate transport system permease small subunit